MATPPAADPEARTTPAGQRIRSVGARLRAWLGLFGWFVAALFGGFLVGALVMLTGTGVLVMLDQTPLAAGTVLLIASAIAGSFTFVALHERFSSPSRRRPRFCPHCGGSLASPAEHRSLGATLARRFGVSVAAVVGAVFIVLSCTAIVYYGRLDVAFGQWLWPPTFLTAPAGLFALLLWPGIYRQFVQTRLRLVSTGILVASLSAGQFYLLENVNRASPCDPQFPPDSFSTVSQPDISFVSTNGDWLIALDADGQSIGPIARLPTRSSPSALALFPDRRSLAFVVTVNGVDMSGVGSDIWAIDIDGSNLRKLVEHESSDVRYSSVVIDPSGSVAYFHRSARKNGYEESIERLDLTTKKCTRIGSVDNGLGMAVSPDGKTLLYEKGSENTRLWRMGTDGSDERPFFSVEDTWFAAGDPSFSPNGSSVVFVAWSHEWQAPCGACGQFPASELFVAPSDGRSAKGFAITEGSPESPVWSPDGKEVAMRNGFGELVILSVSDGSLLTLGVQRESRSGFGELVWVRGR